jgi:hypothetical protein
MMFDGCTCELKNCSNFFLVLLLIFMGFFRTWSMKKCKNANSSLVGANSLGKIN